MPKIAKTWLWPDKTINKRESRELRDEHNQLVTRYRELLDALEMAEGAIEWTRDNVTNENGLPAIHKHIRDTISKAKGE